MRVLIKKLIPKTLFGAIEPYGHWLEAVSFNIRYGFPAKDMHVIGVTGTNGKTSTSLLIYQMLKSAGYKVGVMTTVAYAAGDEFRPQGQHMTNVAVGELMRRLRWMRQRGVEWLVLETTSHALAQHRVWGIPYGMAVMTNVTHDHLDYHKTFERYRAAKVRLFQLVSRNRRELNIGIVNADDPSATYFTKVVGQVITYGIENGDVRAEHIRLSPEGVNYKAVSAVLTSPRLTEKAPSKAVSYNIRCHLLGRFNVYNSLAAVGVGRALGLTKVQIEQGIAALTGIEGRMTSVSEGQKFTVIVDFAHTPDALEKVLRACREMTKGKLLVVFGATGDRDKTKRSVMGEVAVVHADKIFLTDDETFTEDPAAIIQDVYVGIKRAGGTGKTAVIGDRRKAIKTAFAEAKAGDTVVLAGMGHEVTRNMGGKEMPWNEIALASQLLQKRVLPALNSKLAGAAGSFESKMHARRLGSS